ncbi:MAG: PaaI family thioesterase [Ferrimicrobium sp.]
MEPFEDRTGAVAWIRSLIDAEVTLLEERQGELARSLRRLARMASDIEASEEELVEVVSQIDAVTTSLGKLEEGGWNGRSDSPRRLLLHSPVSGLLNPFAPPIVLRVESIEGREEVVGDVCFDAAFEGPPGHVHGGWLAAAFDEVIGFAQSLTGLPGMTATLTINYERPTPLFQEVEFRGRIVRVEGRKRFGEGEVRWKNRTTARATAVFVEVNPSRLEALIAARQQAAVDKA